ncbi:MAG: hypothetical protein AB7S49_10370 [Arcobacter sp.]|jgi:hypothetical protein|uniref:hypothetical protein n=1 Tax=unclassified Arcobacter TaxID=2593671 RepID=UPI0002E4AA93|nr:MULTISPECIES: hypothetical protein [unclassified Arcobacter]MDY3199838.1 hypothetical protein [Arcobacter sp.]
MYKENHTYLFFYIETKNDKKINKIKFNNQKFYKKNLKIEDYLSSDLIDLSKISNYKKEDKK